MSLELNVAPKIETNSCSQSDYCATEELANSVTHGIGVLAGLVAMVAMLVKGSTHLNTTEMFGIGIYGLSIVLLFLASTLYHSSKSQLWRKRFKMADHCAIYTLIAGTYTPLMLISLDGEQANIVLAAIWILALGGIIFKTLFIGRFKAFSVILYLVMGWLCVTVMNDLIKGMTDLGFNLLLAGGAFYSIGVIFYINKRIPYNHAIWHLFVLAGALSHFLCIYLAVI
ncbi:hemolysin III family protein [Shewanella sp. 1_MG-2023]|uniref:Hemolysin III family protein n=1 Tax=Shewanella electrodiphila TaxID=934143 RepID=A0ABT0KMQ9_9GAMM|nr:MULTISPECIES: hemolysin III family protein [Shewanella]MCL1045137.1 hemolysin III family protein [Shewanella electrodiphila]MDO6613368.1 hemolysin III family protein [Shewanella sp. 7_MG-2023]MDO6773176.1 hemolysin III family protein [Shewanella sp. 2_MG-2023]MDO6795378.1 hemolysin III family protein [Shewanella sp. 1_MG-2023]